MGAPNRLLVSAPTPCLCSGMTGWRLALIASDSFEVLGTFRTFDEAADAKREADRLSRTLMEKAQ